MACIEEKSDHLIRTGHAQFIENVNVQLRAKACVQIVRTNIAPDLHPVHGNKPEFFSLADIYAIGSNIPIERRHDVFSCHVGLEPDEMMAADPTELREGHIGQLVQHQPVAIQEGLCNGRVFLVLANHRLKQFEQCLIHHVDWKTRSRFRLESVIRRQFTVDGDNVCTALSHLSHCVLG